jgi:hypothetical protein
VPKLLTVNILGKDRKTFKSVKIGTDSAAYSISSNTCTGSQRGPSPCSIYVTFTPNHSGTRSGTLNLSDASGNQVIHLTGTGEGVELSATFPGFGKVKVGSTSVPKTLTAQVLEKLQQPSAPFFKWYGPRRLQHAVSRLQRADHSGGGQLSSHSGIQTIASRKPDCQPQGVE